MPDQRVRHFGIDVLEKTVVIVKLIFIFGLALGENPLTCVGKHLGAQAVELFGHAEVDSQAWPAGAPVFVL